MVPSEQTDVRDTEPADVPALYQISSGNSRYRLEGAALIDEPSHIKFSQFRGDFGTLISEFCDVYETVMIQTSHNTIWRDELKNHKTSYKGITIHGADHGWKWSCNGEVAFSQFHISHQFLVDAYQTLFDKDPGSSFLPVFTGIHCAEFAKLFDLMIARFTSSLSPSRMETEAWSVIFTETLIKKAPGFVDPSNSNAGGALTKYQINLVSEWIHDNLSGSITVNALSKLTNMTEFDFARRFQQAVGMSPYQYVLNLRVQHARELLETNRLSIAQIAFQAGFSSQSHMTDTFRKRLGTTPKAYRKSILL